MIKIIPSLASANQADLKGELSRLSGIDRLHLDIEDGNFIPNITFGLKTVSDVSKICGMKMDAHLMVTNPCSYIDALAKMGIVGIAVHFEGLSYPMEAIKRIKGKGMTAALAVNPRTAPDELYYYADAVDYILVMTAEPDTIGQEFQPKMLDKIARLKKMLPEKTKIWVDGGVRRQHLQALSEAGVGVVIMGRAAFEAERPAEFIEMLEKSVK